MASKFKPHLSQMGVLHQQTFNYTLEKTRRVYDVCLYDVFGSQFDPDVSLALCLKPGVICLRRLTHVHSSQSRFGSRQTAQPDTSDEIQPAPAAQSIENALFRSTNSTPTDAHTMPTSALQLCLKELLCKTWAQDFSSFFTRDCSAAAHPVSM